MARGITDKAESDLHWRCASLRLTALRSCVFSVIAAWEGLHEGGTGGRHASKRAKCGGMGCRWQCYDMVTWHEYLYANGGVAVGTALTDLARYQQLYSIRLQCIKNSTILRSMTEHRRQNI